MKGIWYQTELVEQTKDVLASAEPYGIFIAVLLLWRFALGFKFEWVTIAPLSEPEFFYRAFYSAFTFVTFGRALYYAKFYKVLHDILVKAMGIWELYEFIKWVVWIFLMFISYQYIVPAIFRVLNGTATMLYNVAAAVLYVLPPVGITIILVGLYVILKRHFPTFKGLIDGHH